MTALLGWIPVIIKSLVSISVGHQQFNYCLCPNLNLREISESESEANSTHDISCATVEIFTREFLLRRILVPHVLQQHGAPGAPTTGHQRGA